MRQPVLAVIIEQRLIAVGIHAANLPSESVVLVTYTVVANGFGDALRCRICAQPRVALAAQCRSPFAEGVVERAPSTLLGPICGSYYARKPACIIVLVARDRRAVQLGDLAYS